MSEQYHKNPYSSNPTPEIDIGLVSKTLRATLAKIHALTHKYGFCFACMNYISEGTGKSCATTRKHVRRLIAMGIIRREEVPGYADRLYICPDSSIVVKREVLSVDTLRTMPYKKYLQTDHWKRMRRTAIDAASSRCQLCNAGKWLNVHHRTYERRGREELSDLTVLCRDCHAKFHDKLPEDKPVLTIDSAA